MTIVAEVHTPKLEQIVAEGVVRYRSRSKDTGLNYIENQLFTGDRTKPENRRRLRELRNRIILGLDKGPGFHAPTHLRQFAIEVAKLH